MRAYIKKLQSKPEDTRKQILVGSLVVCMSLIGVIWVSSLSYKFSKESGKRISKFSSNFIMSRVIQTDKPTNIGFMHLEANGIVGYHQAVVPQLLVVIKGEGYVEACLFA